MGKIRRVRQKLHQASSKEFSSDELMKDVNLGESFNKQLSGKSPLLKSPQELVAIPENLFQGIEINFDGLKTVLTEDDKVSVRSIAKSCKYDETGKLLTKKEKQKLKHDLFMKKIDTVQQLKKEALQRHKKRKGLKKSVLHQDTHFDQNHQDGLRINNESKDDGKNPKTREKKVKPKAVKKSKVRQQEMLQEISAFRKILSDPKFIRDPSAAVTECVQRRIINEVQKK